MNNLKLRHDLSLFRYSFTRKCITQKNRVFTYFGIDIFIYNCRQNHNSHNEKIYYQYLFLCLSPLGFAQIPKFPTMENPNPPLFRIIQIRPFLIPKGTVQLPQFPRTTIVMQEPTSISTGRKKGAGRYKAV